MYSMFEKKIVGDLLLKYENNDIVKLFMDKCKNFGGNYV